MKNDEGVKYEEKEIKKTKSSVGKTIRKYINGDFIAEDKIEFPFLVFLVFLGFVYISIKYWADGLAKEEIKLKKENKMLRSKQVTLTFELIKAGQQSQVESMLKSYGLNLKAPVKPPYVIKVKKEDE
jgi:cell division protein FtsL